MSTKKVRQLLAAVLSIVMMLSLVVVPAGAAGETIAPGKYQLSTKGHDGEAASALTAVADITGLETTLSPDNSGHGPCNGSGGTLTVHLPSDKYSTLLVTTCTYGNGSPASVVINGGESVTLTDKVGPADNVSGDGGNVYTIPNAIGDTVITFGGKVYVHGITVGEFTDTPAALQPTMSLTTKEVATTVGAEATTVTANVANGTATDLAAVSSAEAVATVAPTLATGAIVITPVAAGTATITVTATVGETTLEDTITVYVKAAEQADLVAGTIDFTDKSVYKTNPYVVFAADGANAANDSWNGGQHGIAMSRGALKLKVPAGKQANLRIQGCQHGAADLTVNGEALTKSADTDPVYTLNNVPAGEVTIVVTGQVYLHNIAVELLNVDEKASVVTFEAMNDANYALFDWAGKPALADMTPTIGAAVLGADGKYTVPVTGEFAYAQNFTGFNQNKPEEQEGNYVALQFKRPTEITGVASTVKMVKAESGVGDKDITLPVEDGEFATIYRVNAESKPEFVVDWDGDGAAYNPTTYVLDFSGATFAAAPLGDSASQATFAAMDATLYGTINWAGKPAALTDMQSSDVAFTPDVTDNTVIKVTGTLKYVKGFTGFNDTKTEEQEGNYVALMFEVPTEAQAAGTVTLVKGHEGTTDKVYNLADAGVMDTVGDKKVFASIQRVGGKDAVVQYTVDWDGAGEAYTATTYTLDFSEATLEADPAGPKSWDFKDATLYNNATAGGFNGLTVVNGKPHSSQSTYGMMIKPVLTADKTAVESPATISIPVGGPSKVTVYVGYTWDISLGDAQDPARYGSDAAPTGDNGKSVPKEFTYYGGAGTLVLTANPTDLAKVTTSYIAQIDVEPIEGLTVNKVDVWDFGAEELTTTLFNNKLTKDIINGWYPSDVAAGTDGVQLPATVTGAGLTYVGSKAGTRLRTTNTELTRHDGSNVTKAELTPGEDTYDVLRGKPWGVIASNGATMTLKLDAQAGDKLTFIVGDGNNKSYDLVYTDPSGATVTYQHVTPPNGGSVASFYATQAGEAQVFGDSANSIRPCFARVYRESATKATVKGTLTAPDTIPAGYKLILTDDASGATYEATVSGNSYTAEVNNYLSGTSFTLSVEGAEGYIVAVGDKVELAITDTEKTNDVTIAKVDMVTVSGKITGLAEADLANLVIEVTKPEDKVYQPVVEITGDSYTVKYEKGVTNSLTALNVNDYTLTTATAQYDADTTADLVFAAKSTYAVTMASDPAGVDMSADTIVFVNVNETDEAHPDGYTYTFTGTENIKLRDGQYTVTVKGANIQKLTPDLKVNGADLTCTVPFQVEVPSVWDFSAKSWTTMTGSPTDYQFLKMSGVSVNKTYALTGKGGTIQIPVSTAGSRVVVTYCYSGTGTLGDVAFAASTCAGSTNATETVSYTATAADATAGYVTLTAAETAGATDTKGPSIYVTKIEVITPTPYKATITVGADKDYKTVSEALAAASAMDRPNNERVTIMIDPGNYEEQIWVDAPNVTLKNASANPSIELTNKGVDIAPGAVRITHYYGHGYTYYSMTTNHRYSDEVLAVNKANGYPSFTNVGSGNQQGSYWNATAVIAADGFEAEGIIFENSFNQYVSKKAANDVIVPQAGQAKEPADAPRAGLPEGSTAVQDKAYVERAAALAIPNGAKKVSFTNCKFIGRQDTLDGGQDVKAAFYKCSIYGGTDYIMDRMNAAFVKCDLVFNVSDAEKDVGYITAPQHGAGVRGYLFYNCTVTSTTPGVDTASTKISKPGTLGRPWDTNGEAVFYETNIEATDPSYFTAGDLSTTSLIQPVGGTNGLGGYSAATRIGEMNTHEFYTGVDNSQARTDGGFIKIWTTAQTADGVAFDPTVWLGDWNPFEGKDLTIERQTSVDPAAIELDTSALTDAIAAARTELAKPAVSTDGSDVEPTDKWVTEEAWNDYNEAIATAAQAAKTAETADAVTAAVAALNEATEAFQAAQKAGTKAPAVPVTKVTVKADATEVAVGGTVALTAEVEPAEADQKVTWSTSDAAVATVDASGVVTGVATGKVTITATTVSTNADGETVTGTVEITVVSPADALAAAIKAAEDELANTLVSTDGTDVSTRDVWTTQTVRDTMQDALDAAKAVAEKEGVTPAELIAATDALNDAVADFVAAQKDGTKPNRRPSAIGTTTKPGTTKTETSTNDKGDVATTVTNSDGDKTITVVNKDGETVAEIKLPATIPAPTTKFKDVPEGHWAEESINHMAGLGMVKGVNEAQDIFDMNSAMTRGAVATIFFRLSGSKTGIPNTFEDVPEGQWYTDAIGWAAKAGVVTGYSETAFGPNDTITRQQLATMLQRYASLIGMDVKAHASALDIFTDADQAGDWAVDGLAWCVKNGIMKGRGGNVLDPTAQITRAEATAMFDRMIALMQK